MTAFTSGSLQTWVSEVLWELQQEKHEPDVPKTIGHFNQGLKSRGKEEAATAREGINDKGQP